MRVLFASTEHLAFKFSCTLSRLLSDPSNGGSAAIQGMERKVQQLTKVIYHLNSKGDTGEDMGDTAASYENEIEGILRDAGFPAEVSAYYAEVDGQRSPKTNILMKFAPEVLEREKRLGA